MLAFDKSNANLLKELLYRSYVHDAKLETIRYDSEDKCIKIALTNSTFGVAYDLTFKNVEIALAIKGIWKLRNTCFTNCGKRFFVSAGVYSKMRCVCSGLSLPVVSDVFWR